MSTCHHYTATEEQWLCEHYGTAPYSELVISFCKQFRCSVTLYSIKGKCIALGITRKHYPFTPEQDAWLYKHAAEYSNYTEVAAAFNARFHTHKTERGIQTHCAKFLRFISGRQAFKKGRITWNNAPIGTETVRSNGYTYVKITDTGKKNTDYIEKHRLIWEQYHNRKVPEGHVIVFLNSDKADFSIDNLYCIPRRISTVMSNNNWFTESREHTLTAIKWCELHFALKSMK
ncbi:MAG: HNH endonuclease [Ruminococcus sp.]|nr:HNH endonuclease [Ruminococcus sp.]